MGCLAEGGGCNSRKDESRKRRCNFRKVSVHSGRQIKTFYRHWQYTIFSWQQQQRTTAMAKTQHPNISRRNSLPQKIRKNRQCLPFNLFCRLSYEEAHCVGWDFRTSRIDGDLTNWKIWKIHPRKQKVGSWATRSISGSEGEYDSKISCCCTLKVTLPHFLYIFPV